MPAWSICVHPINKPSMSQKWCGTTLNRFCPPRFLGSGSTTKFLNDMCLVVSIRTIWMSDHHPIIGLNTEHLWNQQHLWNQLYRSIWMFFGTHTIYTNYIDILWYSMLFWPDHGPYQERHPFRRWVKALDPRPWSSECALMISPTLFGAERIRCTSSTHRENSLT